MTLWTVLMIRRSSRCCYQQQRQQQQQFVLRYYGRSHYFSSKKSASSSVGTSGGSSSSSTVVGKPIRPRILPKQQQQQQQQQQLQQQHPSQPPKVQNVSSTSTTITKNGSTAASAAASDGSSSSSSSFGTVWRDYTATRGPISWMSLFLVGLTAASITAYYRIERERRLEQAMSKVVSSESDGWSPNPQVLAKRKFKRTPWGWFPEEDGFGAAGKPAIGGDWSLVDLDGNLVTNKQFEGKWLLLYFGFARCPDICPSEMMKVAKVMDTLKEKYPKLYSQIKPVFVTVDPARDSLQALRSFGKDFHPDYIFLTGTPSQVEQMAKKYRVYVSKTEEDVTDDGDYLVDHSIVIYFHDASGDLADCFTQSMRPSDVVDKVVERMTFVPSY